MAISTLLVAGVTLSACGPIGDDDPDPTATSESIEQPTTAATEPVATEPGDATEAATEPMEEGTPVVDGDTPTTPRPFHRGTPVTEDESEATTEVVSVSTPALDLEGGDSDEGTPVTDEPGPQATPSVPDESGESTAVATEDATGDESTSSSSFGGSDGTSGATPDVGTDEEPGDSETDEATPFFTRDDPTPTPPQATPAGEGTPTADGTPIAPDDATVADLSPVTVTSCEPEEVPEISIDQVAYLTTEDVRFRAGPGADCDLIDIIGVNQAATLLGGPVTREDDGFVWAQVEIAGQVGWVVIDVLEPAG